jgi:hypothetical protein
MISWIEHDPFIKNHTALLLLVSVYSHIPLIVLLWRRFWSNSRTVWYLLASVSKLEHWFVYKMFTYTTCVFVITASNLWISSERQLYKILTFCTETPSLIHIQCSSMHTILSFNSKLPVEFQRSSSAERSIWNHQSSFAKEITENCYRQCVLETRPTNVSPDIGLLRCRKMMWEGTGSKPCM